MNEIYTTRKRAEQGFSLVEMIVAMVVFMIIIGSIYGLLQVGLIDRNRASRRSDVLKNARAAMHLISRDALNAGLSYNKNGARVPDNFISTRLGLLPDVDDERDILTSVIGGNNLFFNILNADANTRTDLIAFAYRDNDFNGGDAISISSRLDVTGDPANVRLQSPPTEARNAKGFDLYLVESDRSQVAVMATAVPTTRTIDFAPGDPLGMNQPLNGSGSNVSLLRTCDPPAIDSDCSNYSALVKRFFWVAYKVKSDGTLVRMIFGNNTSRPATEQIQELPVAYNIEDFQITYVLEDGSTTENPSAGVDGIAGTADDKPANFNLVRQLTVTIKVQASENDEQTNKPETITLNGTFSTRNLEYDAG